MKRPKPIDLGQAFEQLTGLSVDVSKLEAELVELRGYSQIEALWLLLHTATQVLAAEHANTLAAFPLDCEALKAFRHVAGLRERAERQLQARVDGWLSGNTLPAVPVKTLGGKPAPIPLSDKLLPAAGYYLHPCKTNQRPITLTISSKPQTLPPGGQVTVSRADVEAGVCGAGEGQIVRWQRFPAPEPKKKGERLPLPRRAAPPRHARDYVTAALFALLSAGVWWLLYWGRI